MKAFLTQIIDLIYLITGEFAWWLPANNLYNRTESTHPFPDTTRPIICLHASETSALLAIVSNLLKHHLPIAVLPHIKKNIDERILTPFKNEHFWWMGEGKEHLNNWTPWCLQNLMLSFLLIEEKEERKRSAINKILTSLTYFINQYEEDGGCEEGAGYFHHAALTFFGCIYTLNLLTKDAFKEKKVINMASYLSNVNVKDDAYLNLGDCDVKLERCGVKAYLFGKATNNNKMIQFAAQDYRTLPIKEQLLLFNRYAFDPILIYKYKEELLSVPQKPIKKGPFLYYKSTGLAIYRKGPFILSINCGNNGVSHNHNDCGSIKLYKNNESILIDVGVEEYTAKTFSPLRYDIWTMQDKYHNVTMFENCPQMTGKNYQAKILTINDNEVNLELNGAYQNLNGSYERALSIKEDEIILVDKTTSLLPHKLVFMSEQKPVIINTGFMIASANFYTLGKIETEEIRTTDRRLVKSYPNGIIYRTTINYDKAIQITIR